MCGGPPRAPTLAVGTPPPTGHDDDAERTAVLARLTDAHCHPTDEHGYTRPSASDMLQLQLGRACAMASTLDNQRLITELFDAYPERIVPCYGLHPWWSHELTSAAEPVSKEAHYRSLLLSSSSSEADDQAFARIFPTLRDPVPLSDFLAQLEQNLLAQPSAMLGEVGLDKSFRIPDLRDSSVPTTGWAPTKKTTLATPLGWQREVVARQIEVAVRLGRNISFHSVRAPQDTVELLRDLKKMDGWDRIHLCLHSFGGSPETVKQIQKEHSNIFFSFATIVSGRSPKFADLLRAVAPDKLLVESDFYSPRVLDAQVWEVFQAVKAARGWTTDEAVNQLEVNWTRFAAPPSLPPGKKTKASTP